MNHPRSDRSRIVIGVFVILLGVLALADNLLQINTRQIFQFWPMVFLVLGAMKMTNTRHPAGFVLGGILVALGLLMTLSNLGWVTFHLRDWWPLLFIAAGVAMIGRGQLERGLRAAHENMANGATPNGGNLHAVAVMSGNKMSVSEPDFRRAEATAVMGGLEIDLRQSDIQSEAVLSVFAVWGGIVLKVPPQWSVVCQGMPIMGAIEDKTVPPLTPGKRLIVDGFVLMGGVEIKN